MQQVTDLKGQNSEALADGDTLTKIHGADAVQSGKEDQNRSLKQDLRLLHRESLRSRRLCNHTPQKAYRSVRAFERHG